MLIIVIASPTPPVFSRFFKVDGNFSENKRKQAKEAPEWVRNINLTYNMNK